MAANLVSLVMQFLTPDMIGRIAAALGLDRNKVGSAISGAVPALLAAFNNAATQPGGAQKLADAAKQQTGTLGNFANMLGSGGESSLLQKGSQMLSSLVGGQNQNALTDAIAKFTGLGQGASGSLLGMLAPIVMGTIAQHQGTTHGLNANGIANLFASQKDNIAAALPSGLSSLLSGTGLLNSLGDATRTATAAGSEAMTVGHLLRMTAGNGYRWPGRVARVAVRPRQGLAHGRHLRAVRNRAPAARRLREHHRVLPGTDHAHPRLRVGTHCARVGISQADRRY